jgi:RNA-directed DNA polymerase
MNTVKPFDIPKRLVWEAYKRVKANKGSAGVDGQTITEFEGDLKNNLYKLWNRMSSGSYFPPPVRIVEIPKSDNKVRRLGIPTISDRIAQMVAKMLLEPSVEPHFHSDSYGYRPRKSAHDAIGKARERCWRNDWCIDLDIKGFFDNLDHELVMKAVSQHTECKWLLLYVERWLKASAQEPDGSVVERTKGTPQGGVISPLLANLFLHYAFDKWMQRQQPDTPFERYADDVVIHCKSLVQAECLREAIAKRLLDCKLELHPEKTKIVYCKDDDRRGTYCHEKFDFLGYTFRARRSKNRYGKHFINFSPAISNKAAKSMRLVMRRWRLHNKVDRNIDDLGRMFHATIRGWINYYGRYYKSALSPIFEHLNRLLVKWVMRKYKKFKGHQRRATYWLGKVARREPYLFPHWKMLGVMTAAGQ